MIKVFKTIYNKEDEKKLFAQDEENSNLIALVDEDRTKLGKKDKVKYEFYNEGVFEGKLFVEKNNFVPEMYLRNNIKEILKSKGVTITALAKYVDLAFSSASELVNRDYLDSTYFLTLVRVAQFLDVKIEELFTEEESVKANPATEETKKKYYNLIKEWGIGNDK